MPFVIESTDASSRIVSMKSLPSTPTLANRSTLVLFGDSKCASKSETNACVILTGLMFTSVRVKESGTVIVETTVVFIGEISIGVSPLAYVLHPCAEDGLPPSGRRATSVARPKPATAGQRNVVRFIERPSFSERVPATLGQTGQPSALVRALRPRFMWMSGVSWITPIMGVNALLSISEDSYSRPP